MSTAPPLYSTPEVEYPDSDGEPMAENTQQYRWITILKGGLDIVFDDSPLVFVAGDLFWYPVQGSNVIRVAPDVLVAIGRPKGRRGSYMQWREENIPPQVVFEVLSPGNSGPEIVRKLEFYERYGVEEFYTYDPDTYELEGWQRRKHMLQKIPILKGWISPRLGIRFEPSDEDMEVFAPDGRKFLDIVELERERKAAEKRARAAKRQTRAANKSAQAATEQAKAANEKAQAAEKRAEAANNRAERLAAKLRALGIEPNGDT